MPRNHPWQTKFYHKQAKKCLGKLIPNSKYRLNKPVGLKEFKTLTWGEVLAAHPYKGRFEGPMLIRTSAFGDRSNVVFLRNPKTKEMESVSLRKCFFGKLKCPSDVVGSEAWGVKVGMRKDANKQKHQANTRRGVGYRVTTQKLPRVVNLSTPDGVPDAWWSTLTDQQKMEYLEFNNKKNATSLETNTNQLSCSLLDLSNPEVNMERVKKITRLRTMVPIVQKTIQQVNKSCSKIDCMHEETESKIHDMFGFMITQLEKRKHNFLRKAEKWRSELLADASCIRDDVRHHFKNLTEVESNMNPDTHSVEVLCTETTELFDSIEKLNRKSLMVFDVQNNDFEHLSTTIQSFGQLKTCGQRSCFEKIGPFLTRKILMMGIPNLLTKEERGCQRDWNRPPNNIKWKKPKKENGCWYFFSNYKHRFNRLVEDGEYFLKKDKKVLNFCKILLQVFNPLFDEEFGNVFVTKHWLRNRKIFYPEFLQLKDLDPNRVSERKSPKTIDSLKDLAVYSLKWKTKNYPKAIYVFPPMKKKYFLPLRRIDECVTFYQ